MTDSLDNYDPTNAGRRIEGFVDVLSNWYVRRSRRRFWKSENDAEKQSAYDTLYGCLVTLSKLIAPFTPFLAEELYRNLVYAVDSSAPESVHLASFPEADESLIDPALNDEARLAMKVSSLGRAARSKAGIKVRQPLASVKVVVRDAGEREALQRSFDQVGEELNVKALEFAESPSELYDYKVSANTPLLGPKYGKDTPKIAKGLSDMDAREVAEAVNAGRSVEVAGFTLGPEEVNLQAVEKEGLSVACGGGLCGRGAHYRICRTGEGGDGPGAGSPFADDASVGGLRGCRSDSELPGRGGGSGGGPRRFRVIREAGNAVP